MIPITKEIGSIHLGIISDFLIILVKWFSMWGGAEKFSHKKHIFTFRNMKKKLVVQKWCQKSSNSIIVGVMRISGFQEKKGPSLMLILDRKYVVTIYLYYIL